MKNNFLYIALVMSVLSMLVHGCSAGKLPATSTPILDENFGQALKNAKKAQKVNPEYIEQEQANPSKEVLPAYDNFVNGKSSETPLQPPIPSGRGL